LPQLDRDELQTVRAHEVSGKNRGTLVGRIDDLVAAGADGRGSDVGFPIADYDDLRVGEILPLLGELDADELVVVGEREARGANRRSIMNRIDELRGAPAGSRATKKAPAKKTTKAPAKKAAATKAPAKKAAASKAPAAPAKKAGATKAPATKKAGGAAKSSTNTSKKAPAKAGKTTSKRAAPAAKS
jgi:hypothetical protein